jgi:hypothetical protein
MPWYENYASNNEKRSHNVGLATKGRNYSKSFENIAKSERLMQGVEIWCSYYRANIDVFVEEYLGITLKPFQKIWLIAMNSYNYSMFFAARGLSKTFMVAIYCVARSILYPGTKIVIASGVKSQAFKVVSDKIPELMSISKTGAIQREIKGSIRVNTNSDEPAVVFQNSSWIRVVTASANSRSNRANLLILDEFRLIKPEVYNAVLKRFLAVQRQPGFLNKEEYKNKPEYQERNQEVMLSSCWFKYNWSYLKYKSTLANMVKGKNYFVSGLPYQIGVKEGLISKKQLLDDMSESDFDPVSFEMELKCLFYGESTTAYFKFDEIAPCRTLTKPLLPMTDEQYVELKGNPAKLPFYRAKLPNEIRILAADLAFVAGKHNDTSAYLLVSMIPRGTGFIKQLDYVESHLAGATSDQLALRLKKLFFDPNLQCDFLVLDTMGGAIGTYDELIKPTEDEARNRVYAPFVAMNDESKITRSIEKDALPVIYSVTTSGTNAAATLNEMYTFLRNLFQTKKIRLLTNELEGREYLIEEHDFLNKSSYDEASLLAPYMLTSRTVTQLTQLESEVRGGYIRLSEISGHTKDLGVSLFYATYYVKILEAEFKRRNKKSDYSELFSGNQLSSRASVSPFGTRQNPYAGRSNPFRR